MTPAHNNLTLSDLIEISDLSPVKLNTLCADRTLSSKGQNMSVKVFKRGEVIFKEGDKINSLYLVQSGGVSICILKPKKNIEMFQLGAQSLLGEQALIGATTHNLSAVATAETKVLEIPLDAVKQNIEASAPILKVLTKSLIERLKFTSGEVRSAKMSTDSSPCPEDQVPQVFSSIYYTFLQKGEKNKTGETEINWSMLKQYTQKVFGQSPKRIEQACNIFVKQKLAALEMGKNPENPDGPDEVVKVTFKDIQPLEAFFEFYQYYFYKPGKGDYLKVDDTCHALLELMIKGVHGQEPDRYGIVNLPFQKFQDDCKTELGINLNKDHFARLEQKGIYCKRNTKKDNTVDIQFEYKEFRNMFYSWKILKDIDRWNEKGFLDPLEVDLPFYKKTTLQAGTIECSGCHSAAPETAKFCPECGASLKAAA